MTEKMRCEKWRYKADNAKPCPFCSSDSISVAHKEVRFIGYIYDGIKKLKMQAYCMCNVCHAKGKPIIYTGYNANVGFYDNEHLPIYACGDKAIAAWNNRKGEKGV